MVYDTTTVIFLVLAAYWLAFVLSIMWLCSEWSCGPSVSLCPACRAKCGRYTILAFKWNTNCDECGRDAHRYDYFTVRYVIRAGCLLVCIIPTGLMLWLAHWLITKIYRGLVSCARLIKW